MPKDLMQAIVIHVQYSSLGSSICSPRLSIEATLHCICYLKIYSYRWKWWYTFTKMASNSDNLLKQNAKLYSDGELNTVTIFNSSNGISTNSKTRNHLFLREMQLMFDTKKLIYLNESYVWTKETMKIECVEMICVHTIYTILCGPQCAKEAWCRTKLAMQMVGMMNVCMRYARASLARCQRYSRLRNQKCRRSSTDAPYRNFPEQSMVPNPVCSLVVLFIIITVETKEGALSYGELSDGRFVCIFLSTEILLWLRTRHISTTNIKHISIFAFFHS